MEQQAETAETKRPKRGQPTKFQPEFVDEARELCAAGATDAELAENFDISISSLYNWRARHPEFLQAIKLGKAEADQRVERTLYQRAVGYEIEAEKVFMPAGAPAPVHATYREHIPAETTAMIFWLKNRKPAEWRDKVEISGEVDHRHTHELAPHDVARALAALIAEAQANVGPLIEATANEEEGT